MNFDFSSGLITVFAYIDPGTGSYIFQITIATALGLAATTKIYWKKIAGYLKRKKGQ